MIKFLTFKNIVILIAGLLILSAAGIGYLFYRDANPPNPQKEIINKISALMELPPEEPSIMDITDVSQLQGQAFFLKAINGDKLIIYPQTQKAILYRPSTNKIIDVAPLILPTGQATPAPTSSITPSALAALRLALYNGTDIAGFTRIIESRLKTKNINGEVTVRGNTVNKFEETLVVDLTKNNSQYAQTIADELKGIVGQLPASEATASATADQADILIFLGNSTPK